VTGGLDIGSYSLSPAGPGVTISPFGAFAVDNVLYPASDPFLDVWGLLFTGGGLEINIWGNAPDNYSFYSHNGSSFNVADASVSTFSASAVPEPATFLLLGTSLLGFGVLRRRRKGLIDRSSSGVIGDVASHD
jgi:PEP-CTERM motif